MVFRRIDSLTSLDTRTVETRSSGIMIENESSLGDEVRHLLLLGRVSDLELLDDSNVYTQSLQRTRHFDWSLNFTAVCTPPSC